MHGRGSRTTQSRQKRMTAALAGCKNGQLVSRSRPEQQQNRGLEPSACPCPSCRRRCRQTWLALRRQRERRCCCWPPLPSLLAGRPPPASAQAKESGEGGQPEDRHPGNCCRKGADPASTRPTPGCLLPLPACTAGGDQTTATGAILPPHLEDEHVHGGEDALNAALHDRHCLGEGTRGGGTLCGSETKRESACSSKVTDRFQRPPTCMHITTAGRQKRWHQPPARSPRHWQPRLDIRGRQHSARHAPPVSNSILCTSPRPRGAMRRNSITCARGGGGRPSA